jgi:LuxR family transcriptional regulator, maltose regulon positive regulatory protein
VALPGRVAVNSLGRPLARPGTVRRPLLIERLAQADLPPIVSVVAPSGFGKTTLLSQWAEHDSLAFAWVPVEEADNDPKVLLRRIAEALDAVEPIGQPVFDALTSSGSSIAGSVIPRLGSALLSITSPVALVLDDVHVLRNSECRAAVSTLADHVPRGSHLVLSGQFEPPLRIARLRAEGRVLEIGPGDLSLTREEALVDPLTPAELRILKLLPTSTYLQTANTLYVSRNTVKTHLRSIYQKLGVSSSAEALERAVDLHLL